MLPYLLLHLIFTNSILLQNAGGSAIIISVLMPAEKNVPICVLVDPI